MARIVFKIFHGFGHYNATFFLADQLKKDGHEIIYIGIKEFEDLVRSQGFDFFCISEKVVQVPIPRIKERNKRFNHISIFNNKRSFKNKKTLIYKSKCFFEDIDSLNPDIVLLDSPFVRYALLLNAKNIKYMILESMVTLHQDKFVPPFNTAIVAKNNKFFALLNLFIWNTYYLNRSIINLKHYVQKGFGQYFLINHLLRKYNYPKDIVDFRRALHIGIKNVPELILSPEEFEYPFRTKKKNQQYIGSPTLSRIENEYDFKYNEFKKSTKSKRIILCSLGSMNRYHYKNCVSFFKKIIKISESFKDYIIVIAIGKEIDIKEFHDIPENVRIFSKVPQIDLLKECVLMITHGGMNSITECLLTLTPMLVYPISRWVDQKGNAARVKYHKIGLKGNIRTDSKRQIKKKINNILNDEEFVKNVNSMNIENLQKNKTQKGIKIINDHLFKKSVKSNEMACSTI